MAHGKQRDEWSRLSALLATLVNLHRDPKKEPITPGQMDIFDTRGELKRPRKTQTPPLSQLLAESGVQHRPEGVTDGPDSQTDKHRRS